MHRRDGCGSNPGCSPLDSGSDRGLALTRGHSPHPTSLVLPLKPEDSSGLGSWKASLGPVSLEASTSASQVTPAQGKISDQDKAAGILLWAAGPGCSLIKGMPSFSLFILVISWTSTDHLHARIAMGFEEETGLTTLPLTPQQPSTCSASSSLPFPAVSKACSLPVSLARRLSWLMTGPCHCPEERLSPHPGGSVGSDQDSRVSVQGQLGYDKNIRVVRGLATPQRSLSCPLNPLPLKRWLQALPRMSPGHQTDSPAPALQIGSWSVWA